VNHIGNIINELRCSMNITRAGLARGICTEKYIYLIEKGKRTPSSDILKLLSGRLRVNLFDYFEFLDCINPIKVNEIMKGFQLCQRNTDFAAAKKLIGVAKKMPDFKCEPWIFEIETNKAAYKAFNENKYEEAINDSNEMLKKIEPKYLNSIHVAKIYVLISTCYQIIGDLVSAKDAALKAYEITCNNHGLISNVHDIITSRLNVQTLYYLSAEYNKSIDVGEKLLKYNNEMSSFSRLHFIYAFLAFSYYKIEGYDKAFLYFKKLIFVLLVGYNPLDFYHISTQDVFDAMINNKRINRMLVRELNGRYQKAK